MMATEESAAPPKKKSIAETTSKIVKLIEPLSDEERNRVLEALTTLYGA